MASVGIIPRLPSVTNVDHIAVRESVVKAVQTLGYDYPTKEHCLIVYSSVLMYLFQSQKSNLTQ